MKLQCSVLNTTLTEFVPHLRNFKTLGVRGNQKGRETIHHRIVFIRARGNLVDLGETPVRDVTLAAVQHPAVPSFFRIGLYSSSRILVGPDIVATRHGFGPSRRQYALIIIHNLGEPTLLLFFIRHVGNRRHNLPCLVESDSKSQIPIGQGFTHDGASEHIGPFTSIFFRNSERPEASLRTFSNDFPV